MENRLGVSNPQTVFLSRVSPIRTAIGEGMDARLLRVTYPERTVPTHYAAVCGHIIVLEFSCFSTL